MLGSARTGDGNDTDAASEQAKIVAFISRAPKRRRVPQVAVLRDLCRSFSRTQLNIDRKEVIGFIAVRVRRGVGSGFTGAGRQQVRTNELAQPSSVTEHTTRLLDSE